MNFATVRVYCPEAIKDYLIAELFEIGFDSFQEFDDGFEGSCEESLFEKDKVETVLSQFPTTRYHYKKEEKVNWNKEWENNYHPVTVDGKCLIRASFHEPNSAYDYEIIITPKMSFGTGHHATTHQILSYQMTLDHVGKRVLDVGTGTGVLSIMASKRGASSLVATDIDDWCIENSTENFALNNISDFKLFKLPIEELTESRFDIVIANINKNVLLEQIGEYAKRLKADGVLILSGFYSEDIPDLIKEAGKHSLIKNTQSTKDNWSMLVLTKQSI